MNTNENITLFLDSLKKLIGIKIKLVTHSENNKLEDYVHEAPSVLVSYLYNRFNNLGISQKLSEQQTVHLRYSLGIEFIYIPYHKDCFIALGPFTSEFLSADEIEGRLMGAGLTLSPALYRFFSKELPILSAEKREALLELLFQHLKIPSNQQNITQFFLPGENRFYPKSTSLSDLAEYEKMLYRYEESLEFAKQVSNGDFTKCMELLKNALAYRIPRQYSDNDQTNETIVATRIGELFYLSAIKGGVSPLEAENIYTKYIREILQADSVDIVRELNRTMLHSFCDAVKNNKTSKYSSNIQKVANYLSLTSGEELDMEDLSHIFKKPLSLLEKEFREETGFTIKQYHRNVRLHRASVLLKETNLPISQISAQTGFLDQNYFARQFKKQYKCSPSEYRYNSNIN